MNEAQHYVGAPGSGQRIAAALHGLLTRPECGPVLILGTMWPEYAHLYTALPTFDRLDRYSRTRELSGCMVTVADKFDDGELDRVVALARDGDRLLADTLTRARADGRVTQDLAGAPELLRRYEQAAPASRAVLEVAMDARRLGVNLHLPGSFLTNAATGYLSDHDYDRLPDDWPNAAFDDLARPVHGKQEPLRRAHVRPDHHPPGLLAEPVAPISSAEPVFRLADYLEQHGRATRTGVRPPDSFWHAAHTCLTRPDDLHELAKAAGSVGQRQWSYHLFSRAAEAGDANAWYVLGLRAHMAGDVGQAETLYQRALDAGVALALYDLMRLREEAGDRTGAEAAARRAAADGYTEALYDLAWLREQNNDSTSAEALYQEAAEAGDLAALLHLARLRDRAGDLASAEALYQQAAETGYGPALHDLTRLREEAGDRTGAEAAARRAAADGYTEALYDLAWLREQNNDSTSAEALYQEAAEAGDLAARTLPKRVPRHR
ncbi:hypothetical protein ACIPSA_50685 [Streptomyces sp. NPDC086549]|uniref:hypothetical protein n=1 Tax=Streptomyces sp. NPDC086549 TaxID=3365752 RepID=UPI0037F6DFFF